MNAGMYSSATPEWETPQDLFDKLNAEFHFVLDVAASGTNTKCDKYFDQAGLLQDWTCYGWKWMNPPYGREIGKWVGKAAAAGQVVALLPSRTDTRWWHDYIWDRAMQRPHPKTEVRFIKGRLKFGGLKTPAPFPSAIVVFR